MEMQLTEPGRVVVGSKIKLVVGIFFTVVGVLLALDNFDIYFAGDLLRYWPVVFIVIGALKFNDAGSRGLAVFSIAVGVLLIANNAHWLRFSLRLFWPLVLIAIGVAIVFRAFGVAIPNAFVLTAPLGRSGDTLWSMFNHKKLTRPANEMAGKRLVAFMGAHVLELTEPASYDGPIVIEAMAMWGGIEIKVPPGWEVIVDVVPVMGGIDARTSAARGGRQLIVRGLVWMAGLEVRNAEARMQ
jgi:hypothetical protein